MISQLLMAVILSVWIVLWDAQHVITLIHSFTALLAKMVIIFSHTNAFILVMLRHHIWYKMAIVLIAKLVMYHA